ncbi:protein kinase:ABC1 family [Tribonema minus]|uniref:Protein kinase:ABC1 family n=1 Tax=Tribonema minus TaxID=303371 RepID=A0A835Z5E1_9STRA|nr:protein kinase:ABC1 family [Tribonema minus]
MPDLSQASSFDVSQQIASFLEPALARAQLALEAAGIAGDQSQTAAAALVAVGGAAVLGLTATALTGAAVLGESSIQAPPTTFDLEALDRYYLGRPATLLGRLASVSAKIASFALKLYVDSATGQWEANMPRRGAELSALLQSSGPAYIKLGQGVSIRPDILPEAYLTELQKLQDQVPPFPSAEAVRIIEAQLGGARIEDVFESRAAFDRPVAAASLGQVYQAKLKQDGTTVAVKVQRPKVLEAVTLDLYVTRIILKALALVPSIGDSSLAFLAVIDNWGVRFLDELDYEQEARNGDRFRAEMGKSAELGEAILVPRVFQQFTTRYLLISEWVEGQRVSAIDVDAPGGRERLQKIVATLLNAYLTQLLDSGFLHADPHPGNFLCTPDGRLVILDYGLMTEVTEAQRYALLEYVSHLTAKDYDATLTDLITLGFIPREIGDDPAKAALVAPLLGRVLEQLSGGGGAKAITVESVGEEIETLGKQYPIVIPSYFGLIIRAFSALEGLGLQLDPKYSIVNECFPYLARRLLTDNSPRGQRMLRTFLYGRDGRTLRVDRVDEIIAGYSAFTALADEASNGLGGGAAVQLRQPSGAAAAGSFAAVSGAGGSSSSAVSGAFSANGAALVASGAAGSAAARQRLDLLSDPVARDALKLLFSKDGNFVQELIVEELVRMTDALGRETNLQLLRALRGAADAPLSPLGALRAAAAAPLNPFAAPLQLVARLQLLAFDRVAARLEVALELTADDQEALSTLRRLVEVFRGAGGGGNASGSARAAAVRAQFNYGSSAAAAVSSEGGGAAAPARAPRAQLSPRRAAQAARALMSVFTLVAPGARAMTEKYLAQLLSRALTRLADNIEQRPLPPQTGGTTSRFGTRAPRQLQQQQRRQQVLEEEEVVIVDVPFDASVMVSAMTDSRK